MAGLPQAGVQLIAQDAATFQSDLTAASKAVTNFGQSSEKAGGGVSAFGQIAIGALRAVGAAAVEAAAAGAKAIAAFAVDAVKQAGDFESGMLRFGAVTGSAIKDAGMDLKDFSDLFLQLGADTQFSAAQAQEAAINLAKGGLTPAQIAGGALADTLTLAAAGELDLGVAAEISAKALGVWASAGVTSADVTNLLAQAANASTVDVQELAEGANNAAARAKAMGVEYQDFITTMALIAPGFSSAQQAGTSYNNFLARLQPTTKAQVAAFKELGLITKDGTNAFFDSTGAFIGNRAAAELLSKTFAGMSAEDKSRIEQVIFGNDAMAAANMLIEKGTAGYDTMSAAMAANGTAADQAAAKNQGFNFALEALSGSLDTLKIVIGTAILPLLTTFVNEVLTPGVNAVMSFAQAFFALVPAIQASADPITAFFDALRTTLPEAVPLINAVQTAFTTLAATAVAVGAGAAAVAGPWIAAFQGIAPAIETALGSISAIVSSVITTIQGTSTAQLSTIQSSFLEAWSAIATTTGQYWTAILGIINPILSQISAFVATHGADIRATFVQTWQQVAGIITSAMQLVQATIIPVLQTIGAYIASHGSEIQAIFAATWNIIKTVIEAGLSVIQSIITGALAVIRGDWQGAWTALLNIGQTISNAIAEVVGNLGVLLVAQFALATDQSIATLMKAVAGFTKAGEAMIQGVIAGVKGMAGALFGAVGEVVNGAIAAARDALSAHSPSQRAADEIGLPFSQGIAQGIITGATVVTDAVTGIASGMLKTTVSINAGISKAAEAGGTIIADFAKKVDTAADAGKQISAGLASGIQAGAGAAISAAISVANDVTAAMQSALKISSPSGEAAEKIGTPFVMGIVKGIEDGTAQLQAAARKLSKNLVKEMGVVAEEAAKAFKEMFKTGLEGDISIGKQKSQNLDVLADLVSGQEALSRVNADIAKAQTAVNEARGTDKWAAAQAHLNELLVEQQKLQQQLNQQRILQSKAQAEFADAEARAMELRKTDAAGAEKQFALESRQITERYQLQQELAQAQADGDNATIDRLQQQLALLATTQQQEKQLLDLTRAEQNPLTATLDKLKEIQASLVKEVERDQFMADVQKNPNQKRERQKEADTSKSLLANITALIAGIAGGTISGGGSVAPPASGAQLAAGAAGAQTTTTNQYYYSPTYGTAPRNPSQDFAVMQSLNP